MTEVKSRKQRGRETEFAGSRWFQNHGWPWCQTVGSGAPGRDLTGMPGLAPEIKARAGFKPLEWLKQAKRNAGADLPFAILRMNGQGPETIGEWPVILELEDFTVLLRAAGYGGPARE